MAATASTTHVSGDIDQALAEASRLLQRPKTEIVDKAVLAYIEAQRSDINAEIREGLARFAS